MILIALGANLPSFVGAPEATFDAALKTLAEAGDIGLLARSRLYRSPAWPDASQPEYRNAVARIETCLDCVALLARLHDIEERFGRVRDKPNQPRPLDLDLLDYDSLIRNESPLLPHPRMSERAFVLLPLREVAPGWRHPVSNASPDELMGALSSQLKAGVSPV
ncbi:MAG: 2-amino-4-hydroxy-6-hydroxymethyldihydropteridine diphosphokinase [Alphaproteobacteria bacterium]|nr:2-amino-4-hydroxy-6-hydroxymethyldihydropteridine diphosphokinase [Alphaproteobacteria bacterium]